jgi:DNA replication protein DnaC
MTGDRPDLSARALEVATFAEAHPRPDLHPLSVATDDDPTGPSEARLAERWRQAIPARFLWAELSDFHEDTALSADAYRRLCEWSEQAAQRNLVLFGPTGTGKTHAAVAACRAAHYSNRDVRFFPVVELLDALRPGGDVDDLYELAAVDRLVIDDYGSQRDTDWSDERLYTLVNRRWLEQLPTVVTTNLDAAGMEERMGPRLFSRLRDNAVAIELQGRDRRAPR